MRVLIVDSDSEMLENVARRLHDGFSIDCVTSKGDALDLLRQNDWHVVVACERLNDGSGLDLLSQTAKRWPDTIRLFAASPDRMALLRGRLGPFKLFQTLNYPIDPGELGSILMLAQAAQEADADTANVQHIVLGDDQASQADSPAAVLAQASLSATPSLAAARGAARPLPFTVSTPARPPVRTPAPPTIAPPAQRKPVTRESLAQAKRSLPAKPKLPPHRPVPSAADVLPALAQLRARLYSAPDGFRPPHKQMVFGGTVAAVLVAGTIAVWLGLRDSPESSRATAAPAQQATADLAAGVMREIEAALRADDTRRARQALQRLRRVAPKHERLTSFESRVSQRERAARAAAAAAAAEAQRGPAIPTARVPERAAPAAAIADPAGRPAERAPPVEPPAVTNAPAEEAGAIAPEAQTPEETPATTFPGRTLESSNAAVSPNNEPAAGTAFPERAPARPAGSEVSEPPPVVREAKLVRRAAPDYPADAARKGTEGFVEIWFTVTAAGRVADAVVVEESPAGVFDREALRALRNWRYEPRIEDGVPVDWRTQVRIEFKLDE